MSTRLAVVIPAYRPSAGLIDLLGALAGSGLPIVIVDDGSGPEFAATFAAAAAFPNVQLLRHAVNLGKGAALKTAFNHLLCTVPDLAGVVTADADGQHHPEDIQAVAAALAKNPEALVLGARAFGGAVPLRSRFGNVLTRGIMHALLGRKLRDTQTGLRGIPAALLPRLLRLESTGYEFELEMLIAAHQLSMPVIERPIRTIYEPGNKSSHFNPIVDSMKIYFILLRFGSVSFLTSLLDNAVFILAVHRIGNVLASQILGRFFAVIFNYWMVRSSVFYSHQRHKTVLPKYLGLMVVSGTCSYLGIELLATRFGVPVVPAKLLLETILFFANFAVQRLFIFQPQQRQAPAERPRTVRRLPHPFAVALGLAFVALVGVEIYGFRVGNLFAQQIWSPVGWKRFESYTVIYSVLAALLMLAAPRWFGVAMVTLLAALTVISVGPQALVAVALFLLSASALGGRLLGRVKEHSARHELCATALGAAVYIFLMTVLARVPVNYPAVWGGLLAVPVLLDGAGVARRLAWLRGVLIPRRAPPAAARAAVALLVYLLTAHWFVVLIPEIGADGLAVHLAIPMNIAAQHALTFQPARFVWAVMPMGADFAYSIVHLLGGEYAARLLDFAMLLLVIGLLYDTARRWLSPAAACLLAASFAATPIVQLVTGSLFVENVLAALLLAMMAAIWRLGESGERRYLYAAMILGGVAISCKFGALAFVAVALPFALAARTADPRPAAKRRTALAIILLLAAAVPPYAIAYAKTGNPLFPFLNQRFHSPLLPKGSAVVDYRYHSPLTWRLPYDMTFETTRYYEGQKGSLGFQYLVLVPLGIAGLAMARHRVAVSSAVVALGAGLVVMNSEANARYVYAAIPLVLIPVAAMLAWAAAHQRLLYRALLAFLVAATALDAYFLPSSSYYHKDFCLRVPFSRAERDLYLNVGAPVRKVIAWYNRAHPGSVALFTHEASIAGAAGEIYENHWHQMSIWDRIQHAETMPEMLRVINGWKIRYLIARKPEPGDEADPPALAQMIAACTQPEYEVGDYYLARLDPACRPADLSHPPMTVEPGFYDDFDPAILFRGDWHREPRIHGPDRDNITYTDAPGAEICLAFEGRELRYNHAMGPNYGKASVTIDGQPQKTIDFFYKDLDWVHNDRFCCFGPGRHEAVIRASGEKNAASTGIRIDLDSFQVK
jgi:glycosyltransferase involved in cell wall biosynthesis